MVITLVLRSPDDGYFGLVSSAMWQSIEGRFHRCRCSLRVGSGLMQSFDID